MDGIAHGPDGGEHVARAGRNHRILAELPEFEGVGLHTHDDHVDSFYVLDGEAEFMVGDETLRLGPGSYVAAPIGVPHGFRNAGDGELRMLNIHAPNAGFAQRMRRSSS